MECTFADKWFLQGQEILGEEKTVFLPFQRVSARAIIVRVRDGALLGTLHRKGGKFALPGGAVEHGENSLEAVLRELGEERIRLIDPLEPLGEPLVVDYFDGYGELSIWHGFVVRDAHIGISPENVESRWVDQGEDVWYPKMHARLILTIQTHLPHLARASVQIIS